VGGAVPACASGGRSRHGGGPVWSIARKRVATHIAEVVTCRPDPRVHADSFPLEHYMPKLTDSLVKLELPCFVLSCAERKRARIEGARSNAKQ
jgi:hypothetical protein